MGGVEESPSPGRGRRRNISCGDDGEMVKKQPRVRRKMICSLAMNVVALRWPVSNSLASLGGMMAGGCVRQASSCRNNR